MLPSTGWSGSVSNFPPEHWPLPEKYVGVYVDPDISYSSANFELDFAYPLTKGKGLITLSPLILGDASIATIAGRELVGDIDGVKITMTQTGVFAVILLDSIVLPVIPKCFFVEPFALDSVQTPEVALVTDKLEEAPVSFALVPEVAAVATLTDEDGVTVVQTDEVAETCKGCE